MKELIGLALIFIIFTLMFLDLAHDMDKMSRQNKSQSPRDLDYSEAFELLKDGKEERHKSETNKTGMKKIDTLINTLNNLQITDDRPALWRICESLIKSLTEIKKEHEDELEEVRVIARGLQAKSEECENECQEAEAKVTELEGQLKAMSDLANSAMADAQKWQNAYLNLRVETPIVQKTDVTWRNGEIPDGAIIMSQQAEAARKAQEERTPRNGFHLYSVTFYGLKDHVWHETSVWADCMKGIEKWLMDSNDGHLPVYDCKVVRW